MPTASAVAQLSSPWAYWYEKPLVSTIDDTFLDRAAERVGMDAGQLEAAQEVLRAHGQRWAEFVDRARSAIAEVDEAGVVDLPPASYQRFVFMAEREGKLEKIVHEQLALDRQTLEELRTLLRDDQAPAWRSLLDMILIETARQGPSMFAEERVCLLSVLEAANIDPEHVQPPERRERVRDAIDGWRSAAAAAAREVLEFRTAEERRYHRNLLPHVVSNDGVLAFNTASPGYGELMRAGTRRQLRVHAAARDAMRQGAQAVAAALGEGESLAFLRAYWAAAIPQDDRRRFESLADTIELVLAHEAVDEATGERIRQEWNGLGATWIERARSLVDCEDRAAEARVGKGDREEAARDVQNARSRMLELERLAVLALIEALGDRAAVVLDAEGVPDWIRRSVTSG